MKKSFFNALLAVAITFLFFLPALINGKIPIPADSILNLYHPFRDISLDGYNPGKFPAKNPFINDPVLQTYEWRKLVIKNIKEFKWPLWNPYSFGGTPLLANLQSAPFQITNILFFFLPFDTAWGISVIVPTLLLSLFMYLFLKELNITKTAAVYGAIVLPFSGFFMPWMEWGTIVTTAMWLPLILLCQIKLNTKITAPWFLALIFAISQTVFSGHAQTALYVFLASLIFITWQYIANRKIKPIAFYALAVFLGLILTGIQSLPFWEFVKLSARNIDQGYFQGRQDWFLPPQNLIQLIAPDFFGNPTTNNYWGIWNYWEFVSFIGIVPLSYAIYAIFKKSKYAILFTATAALSLLFALPNPISKIPYTLNFSFLASLQPSRIIFLLIFSLVTLSAIGMDEFTKLKKTQLFFTPVLILGALLLILVYSLNSKDTNHIIFQRNLIIPITVSFGALIIALASKLTDNSQIKKIAVVAAFVLTVLELFRFSYKFTPFSKTSWIFPETQITAYLQNQKPPYRVMTTDRRIMHPNLSSAYNIESVDGYDPLFLNSYAQFVSVWQSNDPNTPIPSFNRIVTPQKYDSKMADLINVKYVLSLDEIRNLNFKKVMEEGETKLYQNTKAKERAYFASEVKKVESDRQELKSILEDKNLATSQEFSFQKQELNATVKIEKYDDQSLTIRTQTDQLAPLIVTNPYYPGWQAYVDNQKTNLYKVNFMFQSVIVPQGEHTVELKYQPQSFYNGAIISGVGLVLTVLSSLLIWKKKYR